MERFEYEEVLRTVRACAIQLATIRLPEAIRVAERAETLGPIVDPTAYKEKGQALHIDICAMQDAIPLRSFGVKLLALLEGRE